MGKLNSQNHKSIQNDGVRELKIYEEADKKKIQSRASLSSRCKGKSGALDMSDVQKSRKSLKSDIKNVEKIKEKCSNSVEIFVKRKVLTDISNIRGNSLRTKSYNSSKLVNSNGKWSRRANNSPRKFIMGNVRTNLNGAIGEEKILTRAPFKDTKASFVGPKTKIQGRKSVTIGIRPTGRNALPPARGSLPILQQVNTEGTNNKEKGNLRPNLNGATNHKQILTQAPFKDMKAPFDGPKNKTQGRKSVTTGIRTTGRNALLPSRRSLPVLEQVNAKVTHNKEKENSEELEKGKGISGVPVSAKLKVAGNVLPLLSNHNIRRNRVSDVLANMVLKDGKINSFDLDELFRKRELNLDLGNLLTGLHLTYEPSMSKTSVFKAMNFDFSPLPQKSCKSSGLKSIEEAVLGFLGQGFLVLEEEDSGKSSLEESEISTGDEEVEGLLTRLEER
ncbi:hypothetical protein HAX54_001377 [Datura stramonium]|uniref:Uncharacterized protein n=1 Tax=Datura stramonium TaxID=4076 RepID=A0ABS8T2X4_DATST|nr:hypothetical protein [Datura stramonium]